MRQMTQALLLAAALSAGGVFLQSVQAQETVSDLYQLCTSGEDGFAGCASNLAIIMIISGGGPRGTIFGPDDDPPAGCPPEDARLNDLTAVFVAWSEANPERGQDKLSDGVSAAFKEAFPCP